MDSKAGIGRMMVRIARFKVADLVSQFNFECDQVKLPDADRKLVFDTQAKWLAFIMKHEEGVPLSAEKFLAARSQFEKGEGVPVDLQPDFDKARGILEASGNGERILGRATEAILRQYFSGGVFRV